VWRKCKAAVVEFVMCNFMEGIRKSRSIAVEIMVTWDQIRIRELYNTKQRSNNSNATLYCCTTYSGIQQRNGDDNGAILAYRFILHMCVWASTSIFLFVLAQRCAAQSRYIWLSQRKELSLFKITWIPLLDDGIVYWALQQGRANLLMNIPADYICKTFLLWGICFSNVKWHNLQFIRTDHCFTDRAQFGPS